MSEYEIMEKIAGECYQQFYDVLSKEKEQRTIQIIVMVNILANLAIEMGEEILPQIIDQLHEKYKIFQEKKKIIATNQDKN